MIELEIDGRKVAVREGGTVMDAANELGIYVPHFCYHRKLSIAANCRMCLVDIEKTPKAMPACATAAMPGMIVHTANARARQAQRAVMEFLLINHPLDCPICDQGGECQLQDLAVGYGGSSSRYQEEKRVVLHKNLGPLVSAEEMSRCIHCTRCVRFGQEIAGIMELGMAFHGEHSEILPFVGRTVDSELSGNLIDVCPVGALTSKPFRYRARTWELARRSSISPHDSLGSNLVLQVMREEVVRVVPLENEAINECWLSDRDRFSYEGLVSADRLTRPLLRRDGQLQEVSWPEALDFVAQALARVREQRGAGSIGALAAGGATAEELYLLGKLTRALGSENIDFRVRQSDFSGDASRAGVPWLGMPIAEISKLDRLLLVGSFLRQDHPLLAARMRRAVGAGCRLSVLHAADDELLVHVAHKLISAPSTWLALLAQIGVAVARLKSLPAPADGIEPSAEAMALAADLCLGTRVGLLAGTAAIQHPQAVQIQVWLQWIAQALGARFGSIGEAANSVGGYLAAATPGPGGRNARTMLEQPLAAYLLWGLEPELDCADPATARRALAAADVVIAFSSFRSSALDQAHAVLPIATFAETAGTYVSCEGRVQPFNGAVPPPGEARPGWKVLRVLGNELGLAGFDYESPEQVRAEALPATPRCPLSNAIDAAPAVPVPGTEADCERLADVPPYFVDPIVRRADSLQKTTAARAPAARANAATLERFGVVPGAQVRVRQGDSEAILPCVLDACLAHGVVRVAAGHAASAGLGPMFGSITLESI
ncbi:NADH dehydrogenase I subunit G [Burkholderiales bacterium]|nr:NADH dehydrogenase I subunit G [Burkholderiales bacterium]